MHVRRPNCIRVAMVWVGSGWVRSDFF